MSFPAKISNGDGSFVDVVVQKYMTDSGLVDVSLGNKSNPPPPPQAPNAPASLTATPFSTTAIDLSWPSALLPPGATAVTSYTVSTAAGVLVATLGDVNTYRVTGLTAGTSYSYVVRAVNSVGASGASPSATARTFDTSNPPVPPNAPANFAAAAATSTQINLSWNAATLPTSAPAVTAYEVYNGSTGALVKTLGVTLNTSISGLTPATSYSYTVVAVNSAGRSPKSTVATAKTLTGNAVTQKRRLGTYGLTSDETMSRFGAYPDVQSTYYTLANVLTTTQYNNQVTNINRGTAPAIALATNKTQFISLAANGDAPSIAKIDAWCAQIKKLTEVDPTVPVFVCPDIEWTTKIQPGQGPQIDGNSALPATFAAYLGVWRGRLDALAPKAELVYWEGGYQQATIKKVMAAIPTATPPHRYWIDPYTSVSNSSTERPITEWKRNFDWMTADPNYARLGSPLLGIGEFACDGRISGGDTTLGAYYTDLRTVMKTLNCYSAILFSRDKIDNNGLTVQYSLDSRFPKGVAAFSKSLQSVVVG